MPLSSVPGQGRALAFPHRRARLDQVNFDGSLSEYTVTQIEGGYMFEHPIWGVDILRNIEGLWMSGEAVWYPVVAATFGF